MPPWRPGSPRPGAVLAKEETGSVARGRAKVLGRQGYREMNGHRRMKARGAGRQKENPWARLGRIAFARKFAPCEERSGAEELAPSVAKSCGYMAM